MDKEIQAIEKTHTWVLTPLPLVKDLLVVNGYTK